MPLKWKFLLAAAYLYIFFVLLNHQNAWMHIETATTTHLILSGHSSWPERLLQCFNWQIFEGDYEGIPNSRARILSHIFQTANILFRNWVFQHIPPHPSLSLTWLIVLILSPYYLYKFMHNMTQNKNIASITAFIYIISPGALISIMMLFHPGKAVTNFFFIYCLFLASEIMKAPPSLAPAAFKRKFLTLIGTVITALFFDEYALFLFVLIPVFFPELFTQRPYRRFTVSTYLLIPLIYALALLAALPKIYELAGYPGFNFFNRIEIHHHLPTINLWAMTVNFFLLLHDNLLAGFNAYMKNPYLDVQVSKFFSITNRLINDSNITLQLSVLKDKYFMPLQGLHSILTFILAGIGAATVTLKIKNQQNMDQIGLLLRSFAALMLFTIFFSVLHIANNILAGCGYYGASFSVLFAIMLAAGLKIVMDNTRWKSVLTYIFLISLMINSFYNVRLLNHAWMALHYRENYWELDMWLNQYHRREIFEKHFKNQRKDNFQIAHAAWKNRKNPGSFDMITSSAPPEVFMFLKAEVPYIK